jgi:hypothetical protein
MPYFGHPGSTSARIPKMTQVEFLALLFIDCHYDTAAQRRGWLQLRFRKSFADELTVAEASRAIDLLQAEKAGGRSQWCAMGHATGQRGCDLCEELV